MKERGNKRRPSQNFSTASVLACFIPSLTAPLDTPFGDFLVRDSRMIRCRIAISLVVEGRLRSRRARIDLQLEAGLKQAWPAQASHLFWSSKGRVWSDFGFGCLLM